MITDGNKSEIDSIVVDSFWKDELSFRSVKAPPIILAVLARVSGFNPMAFLVNDAVIDFISCRVGNGEIEMDFLSISTYDQDH